jgi:hypothetical protein
LILAVNMMSKEYSCTCTVRCVKLVEAETLEEAVEKAEEEVQLECDEIEEIIDCGCMEEE